MFVIRERAGPSGPRDLRRRSAAARLLRSWVRIPPGAWIFICCVCSVSSGTGLCDEMITRPDWSYRLWCVVVCVLETSWMRRPWPSLGCNAIANIYIYIYIYIYICTRISDLYKIQNLRLKAKQAMSALPFSKIRLDRNQSAGKCVK
jgi:hypothetical protein